MKKFFSIGLSLMLVFTLALTLSRPLKADDTNIISNGDFEGFLAMGDGEKLDFTDPAFETGVASGYGSGSWDSYVSAVKDPLDETNTAVKFSYSVTGKAFSSFFKFCTIKAGVTYTIDLDYMVVGSTDNFGLRFAGSPALEKTFYNGSATDGWQHASFEFTTDVDGSYDSIGMWFNTASSEENVGYIDNIVIKEKDTAPIVDENIISNGDFEGFLAMGDGEKLDFTDPAFETGVASGYGSGSWDSYVSAVKDPLDETNTAVKFSYSVTGKAFSSFFKFCTIKAGVTYTIDLDYMVVGSTDNFGLRFAGSPALEKTFYSGSATDGWQHASFEFTTDVDGSYDSIGMWFNTASSDENVGYVDNIVIKEVTNPNPTPDPTPDPTPVNPIDPSKTYYVSESKTVNGDFEAFAAGTVLSEDQLEGAWGSVSLDNPAKIEEVDGSKVLALGKGEKVYSSAFLMLPDDLEEGQILRFSYDVKLVLKNNPSAYTNVDSCFVGGSNIGYYNIDYRSIDFASNTNVTSGAESYHYPIKITALENGWYHVEFDYKLTRKDLIQTNSARWLLTAMDQDDKLYIDNVNLYELSETPFIIEKEVEKITINEGTSLNLTKGEEKQLTVTINPSDAKTVLTYKSSNEKVATVSADGKVTAIGKGACSITVTATNGVSAEIAIIVSEASPSPTPTPTPAKKGCFGSISLGVGLGGTLLLGGLALIFTRKKKEN